MSSIRKALLNNSSANIKLSKNQFHKIRIWGGISGRFLWPIRQTGLPLTNDMLKPLAKNPLIPLGLKAAISVTSRVIQMKFFDSGMRTLIILDEEMDDIMRKVKNLKKLVYW